MNAKSRGTHRVNVNFSESAYGTLRELASRQGKTISEVLRDSLSLLRWFEDTHDEGARVLVERNGTAREVIWR